MNSQRRQRVKGMKRDRFRRCAVRTRIEQLESRILPGGFLDLLAGAAVAASFDLLEEDAGCPALPMLDQEAAKAEWTALMERRRSAGVMLPTSLADVFGDLEAGQTPGERPRWSADLDFELEFAPVSPPGSATNPFGSAMNPVRLATDAFPAISLVDAFFASAEFTDPPATATAVESQFAPPPVPQPIRALGAPTSELGVIGDFAAGQGSGIPAAGSPPSGGDGFASTASGTPAISAMLLGEGEGSIVSVDEEAVMNVITPPSDNTDGSISGTGVRVDMLPDGRFQTTHFTCRNLPTSAAPEVFYREAGSTINVDSPNFQPAVHVLNDAEDEGVVIGTPGTDETGDFPLPVGLPLVDDSFTPWLEITSYKYWEEYHLVVERANGNPISPMSHTQTASKMKSHSTSRAISESVKVSRDVKAAAEIEIVTIESRLGGSLTLSHEFIETNSTELTFTENVTIRADPCQTVGMYQKFEMVEVTMKYVHYEDRFGLGWLRRPNSFSNIDNALPAKVTVKSYRSRPALVERTASGDITFEIVASP